MRYAALTVLLGLMAGITPAAAVTCTGYRTGCEAVCTPNRVFRYYAGNPRRCVASCEPRRQQCLRTGIWVDLERLSTGGLEYATGP